jgi:hypothetical protein
VNNGCIGFSSGTWTARTLGLICTTVTPVRQSVD